MKIALVMNENSYPGREYAHTLWKNCMPFEVISIGKYPAVNRVEDERCDYLWNPPMLNDFLDKKKLFHFSSLGDSSLLDFLRVQSYDIGIQGGTGILKYDLIRLFKYGILNFHPGDLPQYRGCSAPEWQLWDNNPVVCTCHLVNESIDAGDIFEKRILDVDTKEYHVMRAQIYPKIANFVVDVLNDLTEDFLSNCTSQDERDAVYRERMTDEMIIRLKEKMKES